MRVALFVDPKTAQVTAVSDPLPQILDGVPLRLRGLSVAADAHQFALNLTGCTQMSVTGMCRPRWARVLVCRGRFAASACGPLPFSLTFGESTEVKSMSSMDICVAMKPACPYLGRQGQYCGGRGRSAQAAACTVDYSAEGLHRSAVRDEPGGVSGGVGCWYGYGAYADPCCAVGRTCLLRISWWCKVPRSSDSAARLWCHDRTTW